MNYNPDKTRDFCWGLNNTKYTIGTSFNIARSNGFKLWKEVYKYLNSLSEEKKKRTAL